MPECICFDWLGIVINTCSLLAHCSVCVRVSFFLLLAWLEQLDLSCHCALTLIEHAGFVKAHKGAQHGSDRCSSGNVCVLVWCSVVLGDMTRQWSLSLSSGGFQIFVRESYW